MTVGDTDPTSGAGGSPRGDLSSELESHHRPETPYGDHCPWSYKGFHLQSGDRVYLERQELPEIFHFLIRRSPLQRDTRNTVHSRRTGTCRRFLSLDLGRTTGHTGASTRSHRRDAVLDGDVQYRRRYGRLAGRPRVRRVGQTETPGTTSLLVSGTVKPKAGS